jgi:long-chain acyl-CoA synthetase
VAKQIDAFAAGLQASGIRQGDRVALMLPNLPQFLVSFFGALKAGAVVVPTNPLYTQHELEHQLDDAGATAIITLDQLFPRVQAALPNTRICTVIVTSIAPALPRHLRPLYSLKQWREGVRAVKRGGVVHRFEELLSASSPLRTVSVTPDDLAVLQYTGGTTGRAKGAMLTHRNLVANAVQAYHWQGQQPKGEVRMLCAAPFFHVYGLTIGMNMSVFGGLTMLLVPRFIPQEVARLAEKYSPQLFPGVPTMYVALANLKGFSQRQFGSLEICISGAAPLPPEVQRSFQAVSGCRLVEGYGLTEASPVTHCNPVRGDARDDTIGVPFPDTDAMITDPETWMPLPAGAVGELTVRGPQVMQGYWNRPEETAAVLRDGWLHTGDLGTMDEDGYFHIVDRKKDLIIAGGYNVYPREVDDVLYSHPAIQEAAVIGAPSDYRGETVKAVVVVKEEAHLTEEEIIAFCRDELAPYKVPKVIEFRTDLPKSLIGKVLRRELREPAAISQQPSKDGLHMLGGEEPVA